MTKDFSLADRWILSRLNHVIANLNKSYTNWDFGEGTRQVHNFLWSEFADWYIEASKSALYGNDAVAAQRTRSILLHTLDAGLRLLHPTMPFVTEETWQQLRPWLDTPEEFSGDFVGPAPSPSSTPKALIVAPWPTADKKFFDARAEKDFAIVMDLVRAIRNARAEFNVEPGKRIPAVISAGAATELLESQRETVALLARLDNAAFQIEKHAIKPAPSLALVVGKIEIYLPIAGMIDVEKEKTRLAKEIANVRGAIERAEKQLASDFSTKAPKDVVQQVGDTLAANRERMQKLDAQLASLEGREIKVEETVNTKPRNTKTTKKAKAAKKSNTKFAKAKNRK